MSAPSNNPPVGVQPNEPHSTRLCGTDWCGQPAHDDGMHYPLPAKHPPTRVVLVKPGDVLVVGGAVHQENLREATKWFKEATGISLLVCADDVTISTAPAGLYALLEYCRDQADREDETWAGGWRAAHANLALRIERALSGQAEAEGRL